MSFHNRFGTRNERIKNQRKTLNSSKPKTECSRWDSISRRYWISFFDANGDRSTQVICSSWSGGSFIWKFYADFVVICRRRKQRKIWIHSDSIIKHDSDSAYTILKIKQVWIKKKNMLVTSTPPYLPPCTIFMFLRWEIFWWFQR